MVALVGEPGIGKSRLALEMRQRAEAGRLHDRVDELAVVRIGVSVPPRQPARRPAARPATGPEHRRCAPRRRRRRSTRTRSVDGPPSSTRSSARPPTTTRSLPTCRRRGGSGSSCTRSVACCGPRRSANPMLVVLDDLHWADPASLAVVEELLDILSGLPGRAAGDVSVQLVARLGGTQRVRAAQPARAAAEDARLDGPGAGGRTRSVSSELTERVLERIAGNPLFLEELLHGERGSGRRTVARLPATIHEMLLARLDDLPPETRRTLQLAAVGGHGIPRGHGRRPLGARPDRDRCGPARSPARRAGGRQPDRAHARVSSPAHPRGGLPQPAAQHAPDAARAHRWLARGARRRGARRRAGAPLSRQRRHRQGAALHAPGRRAGAGPQRQQRGVRLVHRCGARRTPTIRCSAAR